METTNQNLDSLLEAQLALIEQPAGLSRRLFAALDHKTARELLAFWLRVHGIREYDTPMLERVVVAIKAGRPGSFVDLLQNSRLRVGKGFVKIETYSR